MSALDEVQNTQGAAATLLQGLRVLSLDEQITFTQYVRQVLPLDGYVFWLRTKSTQVQGSLHTTADKRQLEDETISVNRVVFSTGTEIELFNEIAPGTIWVGDYNGLRFAFQESGPFFRSVHLYHYAGEAVYPAMLSQLIDVGAQLSDTTLVVSNSLPLWLALLSYAPFWLQPANPGIPLYPSFAVPANLRPPYGSVHIEPSGTQVLQPIPFPNATGTSGQLAQDRVRVTLYGLSNQQAQDFLALVYSYSRDTDALGIMAAATIRDEKRTQAELGILAMKKTLEFEVSYNQGAVRTLARQLLLQALTTFLPQPYGVPQ